jgi:hypothetical protein
MGVKFARAFGAHVVVFTTSPEKTDDAQRLGAHEVVVSHREADMHAHPPASSWTPATWRDSTPQARRGYILGITDGLRLATVFDRAQVDRTAVMNCVQRLGPETLPRLVESYLDAVEIDEPALPFYLWDALVATCPKATPQAIGTRRENDTASWVFVSLPHPTTTSRPFFTQGACEAARRAREPGATMGCHRGPLPMITRYRRMVMTDSLRMI